MMYSSAPASMAARMLGRSLSAVQNTTLGVLPFGRARNSFRKPAHPGQAFSSQVVPGPACLRRSGLMRSSRSQLYPNRT